MENDEAVQRESVLSAGRRKTNTPQLRSEGPAHFTGKRLKKVQKMFPSLEIVAVSVSLSSRCSSGEDLMAVLNKSHHFKGIANNIEVDLKLCILCIHCLEVLVTA